MHEIDRPISPEKETKSIFLICPVREATSEENIKIMAYVKSLEEKGYKVHWPYRDTNQIDPTGGIRICGDNRDAIIRSNEVHVWFDPNSKGSLFDFGMAFVLNKPIILANKEMLTPTEGKSFINVLFELDRRTRESLV